MKVLVACEFSGIVRDAFASRGHDAWSCDILPTELPGQHYQCDVREVLDMGWDLMIAHPPCTYLSNAGVRWLRPKGGLDLIRFEKACEARYFLLELLESNIPMIAVENPGPIAMLKLPEPSQIIQPWQFGEPYTKKTLLWLKNLPPLLYTCIEIERFVNWTKFGYRSAKERSRTFPGVAAAMAQQWGNK